MENKRRLIYSMLWMKLRPALESANGGRTIFEKHPRNSVMPVINLE